MKTLILVLSLLYITGCAPCNVHFALLEYHEYSSTDENVPYSTNSIALYKSLDPSKNSYGNNNRAIIHQSTVMYKSPITSSSNNVPIDFSVPLMQQ